MPDYPIHKCSFCPMICATQADLKKHLEAGIAKGANRDKPINREDHYNWWLGELRKRREAERYG